MIAPFLMVSTSSITMQSLGKIVQHAGTKRRGCWENDKKW